MHGHTAQGMISHPRFPLPLTTGVATFRWLRSALGLQPFSALADGEERYTLLLAHAALGGDEAVLEKLTEALRHNGILANTLARCGGG